MHVFFLVFLSVISELTTLYSSGYSWFTTAYFYTPQHGHPASSSSYPRHMLPVTVPHAKSPMGQVLVLVKITWKSPLVVSTPTHCVHCLSIHSNFGEFSLSIVNDCHESRRLVEGRQLQDAPANGVCTMAARLNILASRNGVP